MFLKNFVLIFAINAVAAVHPTEKDTKGFCELTEFRKKIFQYVVLLRGDGNILKGTGYIATLNTLITPSKNLENFGGTIKFRLRTIFGNRERTICVNTTFNDYLSVAFFLPAISLKAMKNLRPLPILPLYKETPLKTRVYTVGFTKNYERRFISSRLTHCEDFICKADSFIFIANFDKNCKNTRDTDPVQEDDPNCSDIAPDQYFPQIGDLLVTKKSLVGFIVEFARKNAVLSGSYYFKNFPSGNEFDGVEETEGLFDLDRPISKNELHLLNFGKNVLQYTVLLRDAKENPRGTGFIVGPNTIITPSQNFLDYNGIIKIYVKTKSHYGGRTILANTTYNDFLSVARFDPPIPTEKMTNLPRLSTLPINKDTLFDIPVVTLGFASNYERRIVFSDLTNCNNNMWNAGSTIIIQNSDENSNNEEDAPSTIPVVGDDPNCSRRVRQTSEISDKNYSPGVGDVLITNGFLLGIMVHFKRTARFVSGEYYSFNYPSEQDLLKVKGTPIS